MAGAIDLYALDPDWGLGILTFIGLFFMEGRQKLSYKDRQTIRDSFSFSNNQSLPRFVRSIFITTFTIEGLGSLLLMIRFIPRFGWGHGIFNSYLCRGFGLL